MINALTVDVEDYFQVSAFDRYVRRQDWDCYQLRVENNTRKILDMFDEHGVKATFYILGWIAKRCPALVKEIHRKGHEIACHGYWHELVYRIGPDKFREDVSRARDLLQDICGEQVVGYRAPSYSITKESLWAFDILVQEGFLYDSSVFPVLHDTYGIPDANRFPNRVACPSGELREFPLSTLPLSIAGIKYRLPIAGGGYMRLFPAWVIRSGIKRINTKEHQPAVLYFHPWEIDPGQPRIKAGYRSRFRHYLNLHSTEEKVRSLLAELRFGTMRQVLEASEPI